MMENEIIVFRGGDVRRKFVDGRWFFSVVKGLYENGVKTILYTYYGGERNTSFSVSNHLVKSVYKYVLLTKRDLLNMEVQDEK